MILVFFGLCNAVLAYPHSIASYAVSVRQYQILQSRFLQCIPHDIPPCDLLILQDVTPAYKGLSPSGKKLHTCYFAFIKIICIFRFFNELTTSARLQLMQGAHTAP